MTLLRGDLGQSRHNSESDSTGSGESDSGHHSGASSTSMSGGELEFVGMPIHTPVKYAHHNHLRTELSNRDHFHSEPVDQRHPIHYEDIYHSVHPLQVQQHCVPHGDMYCMKQNFNSNPSPQAHTYTHCVKGKSQSMPCTPIKDQYEPVLTNGFHANGPSYPNPGCGALSEGLDDVRPLQRSSSYDALGTLPRRNVAGGDKQKMCRSSSLAEVLELHRTLANNYANAYKLDAKLNTPAVPDTYHSQDPQALFYVDEHHSSPNRYPPPHEDPQSSPPHPNHLHPNPPLPHPHGKNRCLKGRSLSGGDLLRGIIIPEEDSGFSQTSTPPSEPTTPHSHSSDGSITPGGTPRSSGKTPNRFNLQTISENLGTLHRYSEKRGSDPNILSSTQRQRTQSLFANLSSRHHNNSDDDSDGANDDYGFLPYYYNLNSCLPASAMHKAKSPSQATRVLPKKWRKSKLLAGRSTSTSSWKPEGSCVWSSSGGRKVALSCTSLLHISEMERLTLQKIAVARLQAMELGCSITIPKDGQKRSKRAFLLRRRTNSSSLLDNLKDRGKDGKECGCVFGIPLAKCIANDIELRRRKPSSLRERRESLDLPSRHTRKSSSSSVSVAFFGSLEDTECNSDSTSTIEVVRSISYPTGAASSDSLSESESKSSGPGSNLLDALSLSSSSKIGSPGWQDHKHSLAPHTPQVPYIANTCFKHLETYGLRVLGIFRIGSSKKRLKQLREEFNSGKDVKLNEEHNPHDVGGLLKEFFRDLPDPLLTRDLYSAFVATRKISSHDQRIHALHCLISLLPVPNRDTLWALLRFLYLVVQHSTDTIDEHGQPLPGNKMDAHNLATLFGPNILHKAKGGVEYEVETLDRAGERREVIAVVQEMLEYHQRIFELPAEKQDEVMRLMLENNPEAVDTLLKRRCTVQGIEIDPETSSSFYEESDSSSIPRSPTYSSETDSAHPRNLSEALALQQQQQQQQRHIQVQSRNPSMEPPPVSNTLRLPKFQLSCPEQGWYRPDRSPSPHSPRISPSPKALKSATPDLRIRITKESPEQPVHPLVSPRPNRWRKQTSLPGTSSSPGQGIPHSQSGPTFLTVPSLKRERESSSNSSLSSYYPTSRSATNSPVTPNSPMTPPSPRGSSPWYMEVSPTVTPSRGMSMSPREVTPEPSLARTSSTQRPLGIQIPRTTPGDSTGSCSTPSTAGSPPPVGLPSWQKERWKHWEKMAQEQSDEPETLV